MRFLKYLALLSTLALFLPFSALAKNSNEHSINVPDRVKVGNTQLKPGTYRVEWLGNGPAVQVKFLEHGRTVASTQATLKTHDSQVFQDDIVTGPANSNMQALHEIDFAHEKEALIFPRKAI